jgi:aspartyl-tRNA(Asn)/glutamyl-tRNA(Gln) amidotransferase subunit B
MNKRPNGKNKNPRYPAAIMNQTKKQFETVIGLEVHVQLNTRTKIFCGCPNLFGEAPNTLTCPVCLGLPGTLPVLNQQVLRHAIKIGLALNCEINPYIKFDRKNYYYPDLPKGYQISQFDYPIAKQGHLVIPQGEEKTKKIRINRAHMEEDAGKLVHAKNSGSSLVDYNRTGTPLIEIVTEPDMNSPQEAYDYLQLLKLTLKYLDVSDCDMEKGSLRCDANISIREKGETQLGTKTELKNLNSFKAVKAGLTFEAERQQAVILANGQIIQETRLWDENKNTTYSMRSKEGSHDYRYFPEPDLVPFTIGPETIDPIRETMGELPAAKRDRLMQKYKISEYDAQILIQDKDIASFFEECAQICDETKKICNWMNGQLLQELNNRKVPFCDITLPAKALADIITKTKDGTISNLAAKDILTAVIDTGRSVEDLIQKKGLAQMSDNDALAQLADEIIQANEKAANEFKEGKQNVLGFLIGQAMKKTKGKANPKIIGNIIQRRLIDEK